MADHEINRDIAGAKVRYVIRLDDGEAEPIYSIASPKLVISDHTGIPDAARGKRLGEALVECLVSDARQEGVRIMPLCAFVNALRRRRPDVFTA